VKTKNKKKFGFTLVELLVVISIIAILTMVTLSTFTESQKKSRDGARKANLKSLSEAINMYYADTGSFPEAINFGNELSKIDGTIYMKKTPKETSSGVHKLQYDVSTTRKSFRLYTNLENESDKDCTCYLINTPTCSGLGYSISKGCGYIITSSNILPTGSLL
jgi:prepilin-type N-terminal cleavage/methylation domain-containing protein